MGKITFEHDLSDDPRSCILAVEAATRAVCQLTGKDPAEGVMILLTAAAHMADTYSEKAFNDVGRGLATALGHAIVAADDFFKLRRAEDVKA